MIVVELGVVLIFQIAYWTCSRSSFDAAEGRYHDQFCSARRHNHEASSSEFGDSVDCSGTAGELSLLCRLGSGVFCGGEAGEAGRGIWERQKG